MIRYKRFAYHALLILAAAWFFYESTRWVLVVAKRYSVSRQLNGVSLPLFQGAAWPLETGRGGRPGRELVLALSSKCDVCVKGLPFYRKLVTLANRENSAFRAVVLVDRDGADTDYLKQLGAQKEHVTEVELHRIGVKATPTIWIVSDDRRVLEVFVGQPSIVRQGYLFGLAIGRIQAAVNSHAAMPFELSSTALDELEARDEMQIVDIRTREHFRVEHREGSLNIPADELFVRARSELSPERQIVIDCTPVDPRICDNAAYQLGSIGFVRVSLLNRGATPMAGCETKEVGY